MDDNEGIGYIFGLSTVIIGLTFIMSMGVFSAYHPFYPAVAKCGDAPNAGEGVLKVKYEDMQVVYTCPEDHRLYGAEKRTCNEEKMWEPSGDIASKCLPN